LDYKGGVRGGRQANCCSENNLPPFYATAAHIGPSNQPIRKTCPTSAAVADAIGMKQRTLLRLEYIANLAKMGNETAAELLRRINNEDLSLFTAEKILTNNPSKFRPQTANRRAKRHCCRFA
jgi:hypothetical protein